MAQKCTRPMSSWCTNARASRANGERARTHAPIIAKEFTDLTCYAHEKPQAQHDLRNTVHTARLLMTTASTLLACCWRKHPHEQSDSGERIHTPGVCMANESTRLACYWQALSMAC